MRPKKRSAERAGRWAKVWCRHSREDVFATLFRGVTKLVVRIRLWGSWGGGRDRLTQHVRGDARKPAVFHDDQICAGLDGELTGRFGGADHSSHRGTQIGVFGFLDVFHVAVAPVEQAAQKVGWDVCLLYGVGMRWILLVLFVLTGSLLRADEFSDTLKKAEKGSADAQRALGEMYRFREGVAQDKGEALREGLKWLRKAADQGHAQALDDLGEMYRFGMGVPTDVAKAVEWYERGAEQGHAHAQNVLGDIYCEGEMGWKNYTEGLKWYRKAADQGNASAQLSIGRIYAYGRGVPKNYAEGLKWLRKAADQGIVGAQADLGDIYANCKGVPKDYVQSYVWLSIAAANGNERSQAKLGEIEELMTPAQIEEAQREARRRFENMPLSPVEALQKVMREEREAKRRVEAIERK